MGRHSTALGSAFISSEANSLPHPLLPWKRLAIAPEPSGHSEGTLGAPSTSSPVPKIPYAAPL